MLQNSNIEKITTTIFTSLATAGTFLFGAWDIPLQTLCIFILLDILTGVSKALYTKKYDSTLSRQGLIRKFQVFIVLIFANMLDRLLGGQSYMCRTLVCFSFIANEGFSIIENFGQMGLKVPKVLEKALVDLNKDEEDNRDN